MGIETALISFGLSVMSNLTTPMVKKLVSSKKANWEPLKKLFMRSFCKSLDYHEKLYDKSAKEIVKDIREAVKKDEFKLLSIFSSYSGGFDHFLSSLKSGEFQAKIAKEMVKEYALDTGGYPKLIPGILEDCLSLYRNAFFNLMSEKQGLQAILKECLKIDSVLEILKRIDSKLVPRSEFDELKMIVYRNYFVLQPAAQKQLEDYDEYIKKKFRFIELRGFSPKVSGKEIQMELNDIFVPLEITADKPAKREEQDADTMFLHEESGDDDKEKEKPSKVEEIIHILLKSNIVILGDPGSGKSTLLKYLAVKAAGNRDSHHPFGCIIPVYFRIAEFADYMKKKGKTLYEFITEYFDIQYKHLFKEGFEYSNLLLFMDGLDEVIETSLRIRVTEQVEDLMARYPYNHYVVTSRIVGYQESRLGAGFKHFELLPFKKKEIATFSRQWYRSIAAHTDRDFDNAGEHAESLIDSISRNPSVTRLASNPLLMTIIALIHYRGKKLPNKRIELYDISTETFLEHWVNLRRQLRLTETSQLKDKSEITEIMAPIAFEIHKTKSNGVIEENEFREAFLRHYTEIHTNAPLEMAKTEYKEFIDFLRQEAGFFYEKGEDEVGQPQFGFIHLTFEEYFAAIHLVERWCEGNIDLKEYVFNSRWVEIIRLASAQIRFAFKGKMGRSKAAEFAKDLMSVGDIFPESYRPLQLVCLVLSDDVAVTDEFLNEILDKIIEVCSNTESKELIGSFSRLFKELLYSDQKDVFINRFKNELTSTSNSTLTKNLAHILMENTWEKSICKFLTHLLQNPEENVEICKIVFSTNWNDYPIQNLKSFRESFQIFLKSLSLKENNGLVKNIPESFLTVTIKERWIELNEIDWWDMKAIFDYFYGTDVFEQLFFKLVEYFLYYSMSHFFSIESLKEFSKKYPDSHLAKNLYHLLDKARIKIMPETSRYFKGIKLTNFRGCLIYSIFREETQGLHFLYYSNNFKKLNSKRLKSNKEVFSEKEISQFLNALRNDLSDEDIDVVEIEIHSMLGPSGDKNKDFERFIRSYRSGEIYRFRDWYGFTFSHIACNPKAVSKIIAKEGRFYLRLGKRGRKLYFKTEDFNHKDVCPPARLLAYHLKKAPYDQQLILDSIDYYRTCPPEEKDGVFAILYKVLNKLG
ncbi:MAG: NACHT domain-containing protein [Candidatus Aminicenantes bacterium]|nr:NACHT domain-containing protein [Candidatus Aminicenantes bacterium]NIM85072.1 NACHT domain-containing protein [Candidatus Aminicenantes bacterium]NIN24579.1 NACHT domain-containing protein [Candidatus Aminicenantes bacterium]NIN48343.1 NACHT domain-containing protein [Candidatus Aminicenantes bacterium]NIN91246.1 NACHT domain-containing protein [Candidatus Aminicenantes bacterium]